MAYRQINKRNYTVSKWSSNAAQPDIPTFEKKSSTEDLRKAKKQSDKKELTLYEHMEKTSGEPFEIKLDDLEREYGIHYT